MHARANASMSVGMRPVTHSPTGGGGGGALGYRDKTCMKRTRVVGGPSSLKALHNHVGFGFRRWLQSARRERQEVKEMKVAAGLATQAIKAAVDRQQARGIGLVKPPPGLELVPQVQLQEIVRQVPAAMPQEIKKSVHVPQIQTVEKIGEVPQVQTFEKIVLVPQVQIQEIVKQVARVQTQELVKQIPVPQVQRVEKLLEVPQVQAIDNVMPVPQLTEQQGRSIEHQGRKVWKFLEQQGRTEAGQKRQLRPQRSDASTASTASTENEASEGEAENDTQIGGRGKHTRRPRRDRRRKARTRRDEFIAAQHAAYMETHNEGHQGGLPVSLLGALLESIDEHDDVWLDDGWDEARRGHCAEMEMPIDDWSSDSMQDEVETQRANRPAPGSQVHLVEPTGTTVPNVELVRQVAGQVVAAASASDLAVECSADLQPSDSNKTSDCDSASDSADIWAMGDEKDWAEHVLLESYAKGAKMLPSCLVGAWIRLQETAYPWLTDSSQDSAGATLLQGIAAILSRLRRVKRVTSQLGPHWDCPRSVARHWKEFHEWMLEGEDGPCYQLQRFKDLLEDVAEKDLDDACDKEWLDDELSIRCQSVQRGWELFVSFLDKIEVEGAKQVRRESKLRSEAEQLQAAINASVAWSLGRRELAS